MLLDLLYLGGVAYDRKYDAVRAKIGYPLGRLQVMSRRSR